MKACLALLGLILSASVCGAPCDPYGVGVHGAALSRAAAHLERTAQSAVGYGALALDASQLAREATALTTESQGGSPCWKLENGFSFVTQYVTRLQGAYHSAQVAYPNSTMKLAWDSVTNAYANLQHAMTHATPPPVPPPTTIVQVDCSSGSYKYRFCPVMGAVLQGQLMQQLSKARCEQGRTFGFLQNGVWVDRGCRGIFQMRIQP